MAFDSCKIKSCKLNFFQKIGCKPFDISCTDLRNHYSQIAINTIKQASLETTVLNGLRVWIGTSKSDVFSNKIKELYKFVLIERGVELIEDCDIDSFTSSRQQYDALFMFSRTTGIAARAIELVVTSKYDNKKIQTEKIYVYMPNSYKDGYIAQKLENTCRYYYNDEKNFDEKMFKQSIIHLINIANDKKEEERVRSMEFKPDILIVTALEIEFLMMLEMLENEREDDSLGAERTQFPHGKIGKYDVVVALSGKGNNFSSIIATKVLNYYKDSIKYIFMTGIAGGIPYIENSIEHIRLGDIVVSNEKGVIQYDMGKNTKDGYEYTFLPRPPDATIYRNSSILISRTGANPYKYWNYLDQIQKSKNVVRPEKMDLCDTPWIENSITQQPILPAEYDLQRPRVHSGVIVSGNNVVKNASVRDQLKSEFNAKAIEMEASGVADAAWFEGKDYFIVRGICDYSNPDKNKIWQSYAAAAAAAFTRELIETL